MATQSFLAGSSSICGGGPYVDTESGVGPDGKFHTPPSFQVVNAKVTTGGKVEGEYGDVNGNQYCTPHDTNMMASDTFNKIGYKTDGVRR